MSRKRGKVTRQGTLAKVDPRAGQRTGRVKSSFVSLIWAQELVVPVVIPVPRPIVWSRGSCRTKADGVSHVVICGLAEVETRRGVHIRVWGGGRIVRGLEAVARKVHVTRAGTLGYQSQKAVHVSGNRGQVVVEVVQPALKTDDRVPRALELHLKRVDHDLFH